MNRGGDGRELAQVNDEIWIEIDLGSIHKTQTMVAAA
jgi:hypothetical protein